MEQRLHQIQEIVQTAKQNTPIYQEKYKEIESSNFTWETFQSLPYLTREEYRNRAQINDLYCPTEESHYVFISGGSTGISKASFWNISDIEIATTTLANTMKQLHLDNKDRALNLFTPGMSGTHYCFNRAMEKIGNTIIPLGGDTEWEVLVRFVQDLNINVLIGNPSTLILTLEHILNKNPQYKAKTIFYAGENLSQTQYEFMQQHTEYLHTPIYSSTETGIIGTACPHCQPGIFHLTKTVHIELLDRNTEKITQEKQGEIVVTSLLSRSAPCLRYRLGDHVSFLEEMCPCGNSQPLFQLQGRTDDAITIGSTHWSYDEITLPLTKHLQEQKGKISSNYAIQLQQIEHRTQMTIQYQPMNATKQEIETLEEKIEIYMNKEHPIVSPLVKKGILFSVQVQRIDNFETLKNPQTGKIRFVRYI